MYGLFHDCNTLFRCHLHRNTSRKVRKVFESVKVIIRRDAHHSLNRRPWTIDSRMHRSRSMDVTASPLAWLRSHSSLIAEDASLRGMRHTAYRPVLNQSYYVVEVSAVLIRTDELLVSVRTIVSVSECANLPHVRTIPLHPAIAL